MTNVLGPFRAGFPDTPIGFDTDVNMAAVSEQLYGGHGKIGSAAYITVGTGIGVGLCTRGKSVRGLSHPEGGHLRVSRYTNPGKTGMDGKILGVDGRDKYRGNCRFHSMDVKFPLSCVEGMANSQAIADRLGITKKMLRNVPDSHEVWEMEACYLAQLCLSITLLLSPEVIVIGGGVMNREVLFPKIRKHFKGLLGGYLRSDLFDKDLDQYITRSKFDKFGGSIHAGVVGGLELARRAYERRSLEKGVVDAKTKKKTAATRSWTSLTKPSKILSKLGLLGVGMLVGFAVSRLLTRTAELSGNYNSDGVATKRKQMEFLDNYAEAHANNLEDELSSMHTLMMDRFKATERY